MKYEICPTLRACVVTSIKLLIINELLKFITQVFNVNTWLYEPFWQIYNGSTIQSQKSD